MVKIFQNGIIVTKGDTVRMPIVVKNNDGTIYNVQALDEISFHLKETYEDLECLIETDVDNDTMELVISHDNTMQLEVGKSYVYDVKIKKENGDVHTFIQGKLKVTDSVCNQ